MDSVTWISSKIFSFLSKFFWFYDKLILILSTNIQTPPVKRTGEFNDL